MARRAKAKPEVTPVLADVDDAAKYLSVSKTSIFGLIAQGELPAVRIGGRRLIRWADLHKLAETGTTSARCQ